MPPATSPRKPSVPPVYAVFHSRAVSTGDSLPITVGEIDIIAAIFEAIDFTAFMLEEIFYFIILVILSGFF